MGWAFSVWLFLRNEAGGTQREGTRHIRFESKAGGVTGPGPAGGAVSPGQQRPHLLCALAAVEIHLDKAAAPPITSPSKCQEAQRPPLIAPRSPPSLQPSSALPPLHTAPLAGLIRLRCGPLCLEHVLCHLLNGVDQHLSTPGCALPPRGGGFLSQPGPGLRSSTSPAPAQQPVCRHRGPLDNQTAAGRGPEPSPA